MKKSQNNFTTPEQSKRLLELGVPANSADCFYSHHIKTYPHSEYTEIEWIRPRFITEDNNPNWNTRLMDGTQIYFPCWSVGQLIKIICNCHIISNQLTENWICCDKDSNLIELLISDIETYITTKHFDFSKLEE